MIKRVIEISKGCRLSLRYRQLMIESDSNSTSVPIEDLGALVLDSPQILLSQPLLVALAQENVAVVLCDGQHLPTGMILPMYGHHLHGKIIKAQAVVKDPLRKRLWQAMVQHKIEEQSRCLNKVGQTEPAKILQGLRKRVLSDDSSMMEAQAAKIHLKAMFGADFVRSDENNGINSLLNYGYSLMRSLAVRSCVAAGLDAALGLCHKNQYNPFALADDVMEIFRAVVDFTVYQLVQMGMNSLDKASKAELLALMVRRAKWQGVETQMLVVMQRYSQSLAAVILGESEKLIFPSIL